LEATAKSKYACPACGAEATWNPVKGALVCGFCGTTSPATVALTGFSQSDETIVEHDLVTALRSIPDSARGWNAQRAEVKCQSSSRVVGKPSAAKRNDWQTKGRRPSVGKPSAGRQRPPLQHPHPSQTPMSYRPPGSQSRSSRSRPGLHRLS
jgi:hypothetical protein